MCIMHAYYIITKSDDISLAHNNMDKSSCIYYQWFWISYKNHVKYFCYDTNFKPGYIQGSACVCIFCMCMCVAHGTPSLTWCCLLYFSILPGWADVHPSQVGMAKSVILTETNNHTMTTASRKEKFINHAMSQIGTKILNFHLSHFIHIYIHKFQFSYWQEWSHYDSHPSRKESHQCKRGWKYIINFKNDPKDISKFDTGIDVFIPFHSIREWTRWYG